MYLLSLSIMLIVAISGEMVISNPDVTRVRLAIKDSKSSRTVSSSMVMVKV